MKIKVVENRKIYYMISLFVLIAAVAFSIYNYATGAGVFNLDVDFSGGTSLNYELGEDVPVADVESVVAEVTGFSSPRVQKILGTTQVTIKIPTVTAEQRAEITEKLAAKYPAAELLSFADVSSTVSGEMQSKAVVAVLVSCAAMLLYISVRFRDIRMGASAVAALIHDMLVMVALYIIFRIPVNNSFIAAVLTILGYSINATIIVFDRIRENKKFVKRHEVEQLIDLSVNQTLARSINTSITTLLTISCVYAFGVASVREFALPLIVGIISGAYSSIFFSGSVWYTLCLGNAAKAAK